MLILYTFDIRYIPPAAYCSPSLCPCIVFGVIVLSAALSRKGYVAVEFSLPATDVTFPAGMGSNDRPRGYNQLSALFL